MAPPTQQSGSTDIKKIMIAYLGVFAYRYGFITKVTTSLSLKWNTTVPSIGIYHA